MIKGVKGMNDLFGRDAERWLRMEEDIRRIVSFGGYGEIRTPMVEELALFKRGVGESSDVVRKEMYDFQDKKGRTLALRPEGTAGTVRAFVEHGMSLAYPAPLKLYYIGPFFRYERPQKGRYRQFHQLGIEVFGDSTAEMDAEVIYTAHRIIDHFDISSEVSINSIGCNQCRPAYRDVIHSFFFDKKDELCDDCRARLDTNPMRILDCKVCKPKERWSDTPVMLDYLCDDCSTHFKQVQKALDIFHVPYSVDPFIVRGLDYYTKTAFEIVANTGGSQNAVAGGGRYDNLVQDIGGPDTPATGFAIGLERLFSLIPDSFFRMPPLAVAYALCDEAVEQLVHFAKHISVHPIRFIADYKPRKIKKALQRANKMGAAWVFLIGEDEVKNETVQLKEMKSGTQTTYKQYEVMNIINDLLTSEQRK